MTSEPFFGMKPSAAQPLFSLPGTISQRVGAYTLTSNEKSSSGSNLWLARNKHSPATVELQDSLASELGEHTRSSVYCSASIERIKSG
ncbi:hypothetical protein PHSY_005721 [Pseudozyma hubeiensis SY62]|uniref:Uncharacterized protein n=1 Tax=Pseudozyma hubeiensis (strain SY62) TaxID=1305764 RepID=R9PA49_PSEHS|nr:hypothetical protein PHSY_005721 [Pseudozyma hubeiensis SY62]GAC98132.1 hypothetical protein PHSY_005721 [Pseudozyma hubeiensis SY62]